MTVNRPSRLRASALGLGLALALAACGAEDSVESAGPAAAAAPPASVFEGEFVSLSGNEVDLGSLEGQDVVLWLWAPW